MEHEIKTINDILSGELLKEILTLEKHVKKTDSVNYAGLDCFLPHELNQELIKACQASGIEILDERGRIRLTTSEDQFDYKTFIHIDGPSCKRSLLIALNQTNTPEDQHLGTHFWKHRGSGLIEAKLGTKSEQFKFHLLLEKHNQDLSQWELWHKVPLKTNQAVLFNANYFHSPPPMKYPTGFRRITIDVFLKN